MIRSETTGRIYTGIAIDPLARLKKHNAGKGAKATRAGIPWVIVYLEKIESKGEALRRESNIKKLPKSRKIEMINSQSI